MNTVNKKEIFLKILESIFQDSKSEVLESCCIKFYFFLLDFLEIEIMELPEEDEADISLCFAIIELLYNFHLMEKELSPWNPKKIQNYLRDYSGLSDDEFEISISNFRKTYNLIKDDFILGLL